MKILFDKYPVDVLLCILCCCIIIPIIYWNLNDILKIVIGLTSLIFIPGYLLLFVIFPTKKTDKGIDFTQRIALSFGISLIIVAITGIVLNYTVGKIKLENALISIFIFEISIGIISTYRWFKTIPDERLVLSIDLNLLKLKNNFKTKNKVDKILIISLIISILITTILFIFVITTPIVNEKFTVFNILGSDGSTTNYPRNITAEENSTIIIDVTNHEYQTINYTIEVWLINHTISFNESTNEKIISYNNAWFINKINTRLDHTDINSEEKWKPQWEYKYTFNITKKGDNLTLAFLLYKTPTDNLEYNIDYRDIIEQKIDYSYQDLYLWINVY